MAQTPKQAPKTQEFGFGKIDAKQKRLLNRDGTYNFKRVGLSWKERFNVYHYLINTSWHWFGVWVFVWYSVINLFFTAAYYMAGIDTLGGMVYTSGWYQFCEVYFFSAQTLTTVGYGRVNPLGLTASAVSTVEMLMGLLSFALVTGLLYGRFSKPSRHRLSR